MIGHHIIYKVKDTSLFYIPQDAGRCNSQIEQRYVKIFQSNDLSSNFYFRYVKMKERLSLNFFKVIVTI